ncbi:MAG: GDP-mannose 4,6-dehydratase [Eubacteriales bacterium]
MKVLITGITGMAGSHLADYLITQPGVEVIGTLRWRSKTENIEHLRDRVKFIECELKDPFSVKSLIMQTQPDFIFHLAAQSFVPTSWNSPQDTLANNILSEVNIFEAVRQTDTDPVIQIACSSEEYGLVYPDEVPITENNPLRPLSPYAVSKVAQEYLAYQYHKSYGLKTIVTRTFNHTGPRRGHVFVTSNFAKQVAEIEKGLKDPVLEVGNLSAKRDFTDVRDIVRGYWLAVTKGVPGEVYQICSGKACSIQEVIDILISLTKAKIEVRHDPARMRPSDVPILLGSYEKFHRQTGWQPEIPFEQTLWDLLDYWRGRIT